jgi:hypothetical protein
VPHAFTLHAIQILPVLAVVLSLSALSEASRLRILAVGAAGYAALIVSTAVQTYRGEAPLDLGLLTSGLALTRIRCRRSMIQWQP